MRGIKNSTRQRKKLGRVKTRFQQMISDTPIYLNATDSPLSARWPKHDNESLIDSCLAKDARQKVVDLQFQK